MKRYSIVILSLLFLFMLSVLVFPKGNVQKGEKYFKNTKLGGSKNRRSCNSCHPGGGGLELATSNYSGKGALEGRINYCIRTALKGKPYKADSQVLKDIAAYIKSVGVN